MMAAIKNWKLLTSLAFAVGASGCAAQQATPGIRGLPPVAVTADGETAPVGTTQADAADDPAIWVDPANPDRALIIKDGTVRVGTLTTEGATPTFAVEWEHNIPTQSEGCVFDGDTLFVGEEDAGIWELKQNGKAATARMVAPVDNQRLVADVEGLATIDHKGRRYLLASSQGDNAYAVFTLPDMAYVGRFAVTAGKFGATSETDGIEAVAGHFGDAYPDGIFLAQDGDNAPNAQNFKLVRWDRIAAALGL